MLIHCLLLLKLAVCESYNPRICQNGSIASPENIHVTVAKLCAKNGTQIFKQILMIMVFKDYDPARAEIVYFLGKKPNCP